MGGLPLLTGIEASLLEDQVGESRLTFTSWANSPDSQAWESSLGTKPSSTEHQQAAKNVTPQVLCLPLGSLPRALWNSSNGRRKASHTREQTLPLMATQKSSLKLQAFAHLWSSRKTSQQGHSAEGTEIPRRQQGPAMVSLQQSYVGLHFGEEA